MFLILICQIIVVIAVGVINRKNKYSFILLLNLVSLILMLFFCTLYTIKVQHYTYIMNIDYYLYLNIAKIRIPFSTIRDLYNCSFALYMFSGVLTFKTLLNISWKQAALMCPLIILYVLINSSKWTITAEVNQGSTIVHMIAAYQNIVSLAILIGYSLLPYTVIFTVYRRTKFKTIKRDVFTFGVCMGVITVYIYIVFVLGKFRKILFWNVNSIGLPKTEIVANNYLSITLFTFFMLVIAVMILLIYKPFNLFTFEYNRKKDMLQEVRFFDEKLRSNLHMYKNMICGTKQQFEIIKRAMETGDYDSVIECANDGINMLDSNYEQIRQMTNAFSYDIMNIEMINIVECMENVLLKLPIVPPIKVNKNYQCSPIYTYGNRMVLEEAFYNILLNSVESFKKLKDIRPYIDVSICADNNICMIEIYDNGCGIPKKDLKKIFQPFYSTKNSIYNSGIGLNFVKKIVKSYHGTIYVSSKQNQYTDFQITIPYVKTAESKN